MQSNPNSNPTLLLLKKKDLEANLLLLYWTIELSTIVLFHEILAIRIRALARFSAKINRTISN